MRIVVALWVLLLAPLLARPAGPVEYFTATYQSADIRLDWKMILQSQRADFEIWRRRGTETGYTKMVDLAATPGQDVYSYTDDNLYKTQEGAQVSFSYKLIVKMPTGTESYVAGIDHTPTAVQRSWGSIKMMFR